MANVFITFRLLFVPDVRFSSRAGKSGNAGMVKRILPDLPQPHLWRAIFTDGRYVLKAAPAMRQALYSIMARTDLCLWSCSDGKSSEPGSPIKKNYKRQDVTSNQRSMLKPEKSDDTTYGSQWGATTRTTQWITMSAALKDDSHMNLCENTATDIAGLISDGCWKRKNFHQSADRGNDCWRWLYRCPWSKVYSGWQRSTLERAGSRSWIFIPMIWQLKTCDIVVVAVTPWTRVQINWSKWSPALQPYYHVWWSLISHSYWPPPAQS